MIVCKCFGITEQQVRDGHAGLAGTDCGSCLPLLMEMKALTAIDFVTEHPFEYALGTSDNTYLGMKVVDNQLVIYARDDTGDIEPVPTCCIECGLAQLLVNCVHTLMTAHDVNEADNGWKLLGKLGEYRELAEPTRALPPGTVVH